MLHPVKKRGIEFSTGDTRPDPGERLAGEGEGGCLIEPERVETEVVETEDGSADDEE